MLYDTSQKCKVLSQHSAWQAAVAWHAEAGVQPAKPSLRGAEPSELSLAEPLRCVAGALLSLIIISSKRMEVSRGWR